MQHPPARAVKSAEMRELGLGNLQSLLKGWVLANGHLAVTAQRAPYPGSAAPPAPTVLLVCAFVTQK